jgi:hypothetical protein
VFKSGNVLSSNGRGIVREVRVAVFAVISRHIRRRDSLLFSLSLVLLLLLLLLRAALLLLYLSAFFFSWIDFCDFFALFGNRPPLKNSLRSSSSEFFELEEAFSTFTPSVGGILRCYWVDERERRGLQRAHDGKSKTRVCVSSVVRSKEREREAVLPHTTTSRDRKWEKTWNLACGST